MRYWVWLALFVLFVAAGMAGWLGALAINAWDYRHGTFIEDLRRLLPLSPQDLPPVTVLLAVNENAAYRDGVPAVAAAWHAIGFDTLCVDISGPDNALLLPRGEMPSAQQAQVIRPLLPPALPAAATEPDRLYLMSDADMLPVHAAYFQHAAMHCHRLSRIGEKPILWNLTTYADSHTGRFPMCYYMGTAAAYAAVTGVRRAADIPAVMRRYWAQGHGWNTDEMAFAADCEAAQRAKRLLVWSRHREPIDANRLNRRRGLWYMRWLAWRHGEAAVLPLLRIKGVIDCHVPRPYAKHAGMLQRFLQLHVPAALPAERHTWLRPSLTDMTWTHAAGPAASGSPGEAEVPQ